MNTKIIIDIIGTCINTIVLGFAIYKYVELNTRDNLEKELENLRTFFRRKTLYLQKAKNKIPFRFYIQRTIDNSRNFEKTNLFRNKKGLFYI